MKKDCTCGIRKVTKTSYDPFSGVTVVMSGWVHDRGPGLFDSYVSALADRMGLWEEYCEYHRLHPLNERIRRL